MNTYDLRKSIHVYAYDSHSEGCSIYYSLNRNTSSLMLNNIQLFQELVAIASLDDNAGPEEYRAYNISQWDALNIVIRFELARETEKELDKGDLFQAIGKIINPNHKS